LPGQIFESAPYYLQTEHPGTAVLGHYQEQSGKYAYSLGPVALEDFEDPGEPIQPLDIRSNERAMVIRSKRRPVILMSELPTPWKEGKRRSDPAFLVLPIYSFSSDTSGKPSYSETFIERVKAYYYNSLFYLPANQKPSFREGFARFDRIQVVHKRWLKHRPLRLTEDALHRLRAWLFGFTTLSPEEVGEGWEWFRIIREYRDRRLAVEKA